MSAPNPSRRITLAQNYRDLGEKQIRAKLDGALSDVERVIAQAELIRRGADSDHVDTSPATGFAPTSALDLVEAGQAAAAANAVPAGAGRRKMIVAIVVLAVCAAAAAAVFLAR